MTDSAYFGVSQMILINSGRYGFAEVDLQKPVHLAAGNNQGKSTLVNALQFLYINDLGNMKFPNSDDETTRHYFGGKNSYLIFECSTLAGLKTIVLRGLTKLQSGRYERYSYDGGFKQQDYLDGRDIRDFDEVRSILADRHLIRVKNNELWQILAGHETRKGDTLGSVKILPVKSEVAYRDFCRVYKKLLTLSDLDSSALRDLVIACYSRNIGAKTIDIATDYRDEFERAERQEYEFSFISQAAPIIEKGIAARKTVADLKAKLVESVPTAWQQAEDVIREITTLRAMAQSDCSTIKRELEKANADNESLIEKRGEVTANLKAKTNELTELDEEYRKRWSAYTEEMINAIRQNVNSTLRQITRLESTLEQVKQLDTATLQREYKRKQLDLERDQNILENWEATLGAFLVREGFAKSELALLFKLVNPSAHGAIIGEQVRLKDKDKLVSQCRQLLERFNGTQFENEFLSVDVDKFEAIRPEDFQDSNSLAGRIRNAKQLLIDEKSKLDAALNETDKREELAELKRAHEEAQSELISYQHFHRRWDLKSQLEAEVRKFQEEHDKIACEIDAVKAKILEGSDKKSSTEETIGLCNKLKVEIKDSFNLLKTELSNLNLETQTIPQSSELEYRGTSNNEPAITDIAELTNLANGIIASAKRLRGEASEISKADVVVKKSETAIQDLSRQPDFVDQELYFGNRTEEWDGLIAKVDSLTGMEQSLENAWDGLFKTLSGRLNGILQGVSEVKKAVRRISAGVKSFKVSNLQGVELRVETDSSIFPVISEICQQDGLFQNRDELENAKKKLRAWIKVAKVITIDSMFNLKISGSEADGTPINAASLDKIGSTGTGITIKAMILCQLMRALIPDENYHLHFFIDETGRLDDPNLSATVQMAINQSVIPITAEPKIKLESLAHPEVVIYSLGTTSDGKFFKIDSKRSFKAKRLATDLKLPTRRRIEQEHVPS